ncbi:hypothetical protein [Amphibiibacter pelophylacis]|uniref:Uncharacterized protein n=1 Tax=Amphibiibacter pelophylacis TaxID=1799477 RepID=A0ACC6P3V5_9BURK
MSESRLDVPLDDYAGFCRWLTGRAPQSGWTVPRSPLARGRALTVSVSQLDPQQIALLATETHLSLPALDALQDGDVLGLICGALRDLTVRCTSPRAALLAPLAGHLDTLTLLGTRELDGDSAQALLAGRARVSFAQTERLTLPMARVMCATHGGQPLLLEGVQQFGPEAEALLAAHGAPVRFSGVPLLTHSMARVLVATHPDEPVQVADVPRLGAGAQALLEQSATPVLFHDTAVLDAPMAAVLAATARGLEVDLWGLQSLASGAVRQLLDARLRVRFHGVSELGRGMAQVLASAWPGKVLALRAVDRVAPAARRVLDQAGVRLLGDEVPDRPEPLPQRSRW